MSGTLFVVATPIGNLEDITLRALRVLREADVVAAEDTRRTAKLLTHYSIPTPSLSFHAHNTRSRMPQLLERLRRGARVALVTDAGTPGISDPGTELIHACWENGIAIDPIPGPSAPITAAVASGFPLEPLTIFGFAPSRAQDRKRWWSTLSEVKQTFTFFETPHRIQQTLSELPKYFVDRPIMLAREMTKLHQELVMLGKSQHIGQTTDVSRGEYTLVVGPRNNSAPAQEVTDSLIYNEFCRMTSVTGATRRSAIKCVADKYGVSTKNVYAVVERLKPEGQ